MSYGQGGLAALHGAHPPNRRATSIVGGPWDLLGDVRAAKVVACIFAAN